MVSSDNNFSGKISLSQFIIQGLTSYYKQIIFNREQIIAEERGDFIHDFRVAVRKSRSILQQVENILEIQEIKTSIINLRSITKSTNHLRDVEVLLENSQKYRQFVNGDKLAEFNKFLFSYTETFNTSKAEFINYLQGTEYLSINEEYSSFLKSSESLDTVLHLDSINHKLDFLHTRISDFYKNFEENTATKEIHKLRITCKKFRYLTEFFEDIYKSQASESLIKTLKKLQDDLGEFNDLETHLSIVKKEQNQQIIMISDMDQSYMEMLNQLSAGLNRRILEIRKLIPEKLDNLIQFQKYWTA